MTRLRFDQPFQPGRVGVGGRVVHQMKDNSRAPLRRIGKRSRADLVGALALRRPAPGIFAAGQAARHVDTVGHHEGGVEAHSELADELGVVACLARIEALHEGACARSRDRAQRLRHLVAAHADAVVLDAEPLVLRIRHDGDAQLRVVPEQVGAGDRLEAKPFAGVRGIRDLLAQEDVAVGIDRMTIKWSRRPTSASNVLVSVGFISAGITNVASLVAGTPRGRTIRDGKCRLQHLGAAVDSTRYKRAQKPFSAFWKVTRSMSTLPPPQCSIGSHGDLPAWQNAKALAGLLGSAIGSTSVEGVKPNL